MKSPKHQGIANLDGREPVGAVLSIGVKDSQKGFPTETDRFHLVNPRENGGVRALHISFHQYNTAPAEKRKVIHGNIVHGTREECFEFYLKAQVISKAHPNRMPCCVGDGEKATRWMGGTPDNFKTIECPHDKCEFRQTKPPLCKPFMRFIFRLRWDKSNGFAGIPELLVKFTSGAWSTTSNMKGFFEYIEKTAKELGMQQYTLFGFPFMMTLAYQTKPSDKSRFPVVTITPEADPVSFFMKQRENIRLLNSPASVPIAITSGEEQSIDVVYEDVKGIDGAPISIPSKPGKLTADAKEPAKPKEIAHVEPDSEEMTSNGLFPKNWQEQHEKLFVKGETSYQAASERTLGEALDGKDKEKINYAVYELLYRATRAKKAFADKGESKRFAEIIQDPDGNIEKIPPEFLVAKVDALKKAYLKLK